MSAKTDDAVKRLREALAALEDPKGFCLREGYGRQSEDSVTHLACTIGAVRSMVTWALRDLGEPIDPMK